jgi:hypothetical protein
MARIGEFNIIGIGKVYEKQLRDDVKFSENEIWFFKISDFRKEKPQILMVSLSIWLLANL